MKETTQITTTSQSLAGELKKRSLVYTILYTILLCALVLMLVFNYFAVFTTFFYPTNLKGQYMVGVVDTNNYHDTQEGQLLLVEKYTGTVKIKIGDEIFFAGNAGEGSGVIKSLHIGNGYVVVSINGTQKNVAVSTIIGQVVQKQDTWGYIVWFFQSWTGTIALNITLVALVMLRTIWGFTTETSVKGRELQAKLKKQKKDAKKLKAMYKNYKNTGLDVESFELLDGDFEQNKQKINEYAKKKDLSNAYKFLLEKVHRVYIGKTKLTVLDRQKITNCVELMCLIKTFDMDSEYMLTDLILKTHLVTFDLGNFIKSCNEYLALKHTTEDLECFQSILYVLVKKNKHLRKYEIYDFCENMEMYLRREKNGVNNSIHLLNLCNYIKKLI